MVFIFLYERIALIGIYIQLLKHTMLDFYVIVLVVICIYLSFEWEISYHHCTLAIQYLIKSSVKQCSHSYGITVLTPIIAPLLYEQTYSLLSATLFYSNTMTNTTGSLVVHQQQHPIFTYTSLIYVPYHTTRDYMTEVLQQFFPHSIVNVKSIIPPAISPLPYQQI